MDVFSSCIEYVKGLVEEALSSSDPLPAISIGGFSVEKPYQVYVCEDPQEVSFSDVVTSRPTLGGGARGCYRVDFAVMIQMQAVRRDVWEAAKTVLSWYASVALAVASDKTLGGLCIHAEPYLATGGTALRDRQYVHAIEGGVRIAAEFKPDK